VLEVAILLRANVRPRPHRLAAHAAPRASSGNHRRGFRAQIARLFPRHAAGKRRVAVFLAIEIVRNNDDAVLVIVIAKLHATDPKLLSRLPVELSETRRDGKHGSCVRQAGEHLFQGQSQGMDLLLLHPDRVCLPVYYRLEPETAIAWFPDRFDLNPLCVEISTHSFEPPDFGGKTRSAPDSWNSRIIARYEFSEDRPQPLAQAFTGALRAVSRGSPYTLPRRRLRVPLGDLHMTETSKIAVPSSRRPATRAIERDEDGDPFRVSSDGRAGGKASVTLDAVKADPEIQAFIRNANRNLGVIGYTEHGFRHVGLVANIARNILKRMGFDRRQQELAAIAGYLHDIGNVVSRLDHARTGALLAHGILRRLGATPEDAAIVMGAIGSHEDEGHIGEPVHAVSAALILADKADVHRSRVRNPDPTTFDQHDRVNFAATSSRLRVDPDAKSITLELEIDTSIAPVMHYFEIFLPRMLMSRRAAEALGYAFHITINDVSVL
jgi:metal-dependent HD superfamily phosphatase/phosphodiesterase